MSNSKKTASNQTEIKHPQHNRAINSPDNQDPSDIDPNELNLLNIDPQKVSPEGNPGSTKDISKRSDH